LKPNSVRHLGCKVYAALVSEGASRFGDFIIKRNTKQNVPNKKCMAIAGKVFFGFLQALDKKCV